MTESMNRLTETVLSFIMPSRCPFCGKRIAYDESECSNCRSFFPKDIKRKALPTGEECFYPFYYESRYKDAMLALKFKGMRYYAVSFAKAMSGCAKRAYGEYHIDMITYVPMSGKKKLLRGYNQSKLLADIIARELSVPCCSTLYKNPKTPEQHKLSKEEREQNVRGAFSLKYSGSLDGKVVLLIDDIITTGNTLSECTRLLRCAGAHPLPLCATGGVPPQSIRAGE